MIHETSKSAMTHETSKSAMTHETSKKTVYTAYIIYVIYVIYVICIICITSRQSNAMPVHKNFINSMCSSLDQEEELIKISLSKNNFNKSMIITCSSCYNSTMYLWRVRSLDSFRINKTNQTQNEIQKVKNVYYYHFNYTSVSNNDGYVVCINSFGSSHFTLIEKSTDNQLLLRAWRKSYPNFSFPDRNEKYKFILYVEHRFYNSHISLRCEITSNNLYSHHYLPNYNNGTFRHAITISSEYNLYAFYLRVYIFEESKIYDDHDLGDTYVGFADVLDYDESTVKYLTREAKHIEL